MIKVKILFYSLALAIIALFVVAAVMFVTNFQALETARAAGETAKEFYSILGVFLAAVVLAIIELILYWSTMAFRLD